MHAYRRLALSRRLFSSTSRLWSEASSSSSSPQTAATPQQPASETASSAPAQADASTGTDGDSQKTEQKPFVNPPHFNIALDKRNELKDFLALIDDPSSSSAGFSFSGGLRPPPGEVINVKQESKPPSEFSVQDIIDGLQVEGELARRSKYPKLAIGQVLPQSGKSRKARKAEKIEKKKEKRKMRESLRKAELIKALTDLDLAHTAPIHHKPPLPIEQAAGIDTTGMTSAEIRRLRRRLRKQQEKLDKLREIERVKAVERQAQSERSKAQMIQKKKELEAIRKTRFQVPTVEIPKGEWMGEDWAVGWGEDKLAPPPSHFPLASIDVDHPSEEAPARHAPPHIVLPLAYEKKTEGLLHPSFANDKGGSSESRPALEDLEPKSEHNPVATLSHGLDRVLFNPGVHWLRDPRSKVYNFTPYLENIPKATDFAFERIVGFIKSSRDEDLWGLAKEHNRPFAGSTSSLSGMLSHIYFLLSGDKYVNTSMLSRNLSGEARTFTPGQRMPATVVFNHKDGHYAIDSAEKAGDHADKNVLTWMGTLLERFLTMPKEEFDTYLRKNPPPKELENPLREAYRYAKSDKFVMRSQLDCHDPRLPGTGVFDIKTRACLAIRMDMLNFEENAGYQLRTARGVHESFEREYYDLIRSAFLKYSFQVRIGNMDGVIVAYHNVEKIFGFQYVPLEDMDEAIFGNFRPTIAARGSRDTQEKQEDSEKPTEIEATSEATSEATADASQNLANEESDPDQVIAATTPTTNPEVEITEDAKEDVVPLTSDVNWKKKQGDRIFDVCIKILEKVSQEVVDCFPGQSVKATFEKYDGTYNGRDSTEHIMNVWVQPADWVPEGALTEADRPTKQLEVKVTNYFGQEQVSGTKAVLDGGSQDWVVHWSVGRLADKLHDVQGGLKATLQRQSRQLFIPTGVPMANIKEWWEGLNFGAPAPQEADAYHTDAEVEVEVEDTAVAAASEGDAEPATSEIIGGKPFNLSAFAHPPRNVQLLRSMARRGREESEREKQEEEASGKKKVVLGEDID